LVIGCVPLALMLWPVLSRLLFLKCDRAGGHRDDADSQDDSFHEAQYQCRSLLNCFWLVTQ
jgi:hypothetical protein